jgi:hypothetical protein
MGVLFLSLLETSYLHQVLADDHLAAKMLSHSLGPHFVGDNRVGNAWNKMTQDQGLYASLLGYPSDILGGRMRGKKMLTQAFGSGELFAIASTAGK